MKLSNCVEKGMKPRSPKWVKTVQCTNTRKHAQKAAIKHTHKIMLEGKKMNKALGDFKPLSSAQETDLN